MLIAFNKPYGILSQFTPDHPGQRTLDEFGFPRAVYPVGRLDRDSEGLLLLTDEKPLVDILLNPSSAHPRTYCAQVEGVPTLDALAALAAGVVIEGRRTRPCTARIIDPPPTFPDRDPPIRFRRNIPTTWLRLVLTEGRNRQVRRMTAAVGHPTLRLVRTTYGRFALALPPGAWRELDARERALVLKK